MEGKRERSTWGAIFCMALVALLMVALLMVAGADAQYETETITWGTSEAEVDTLVGTTADTSNAFRLAYHPNKKDGKMADRIGILLTTDQITDSTNVTTYLDGSIDKTTWVALVTGPAITQTDIAADVDSIFSVSKANMKAMLWGRLRTVPAVAGDSTGYKAKLARDY